ncbi:MAG: SIMPL domain-containing protein [Fusobacterium sp.]|nr:SIMPL domain-containing protein [Fusobacterium sp.]
MKKTIFLLLLLALSLPAQAKPQGSIYVDASSNIDLQPDVVEFNVIVTTKDRHSLENASITNKEISTKVYHDLTTMIDKTNGDYIKTIDYSARPTYYYSNGKQVFDRFEVTNTITVHTKKITDVGMFIDKALSLGATNIGNVEFKLEDQNTYCNELLSVATQKAKTKAETVAQASGQKITGIKELRTSCHVNSFNNGYPRYMNAKMTMAGAAYDGAVAESSTMVSGGAMKLYATVNAEFYSR